MKFNSLFILVITGLLTACQNMPTNQAQNTKVLQAKTASFQDSLLVIDSAYDMASTVQKIEQGLAERNMTIFAKIDHQAHAQKSGLTMQPATVIIFGTPKAGTPLMIKEPKFALKLPLKVLITEQNDKVQVVMERTENLISGTNISFSDVENSLAKAEGLIKMLVQ